MDTLRRHKAGLKLLPMPSMQKRLWYDRSDLSREIDCHRMEDTKRKGWSSMRGTQTHYDLELQPETQKWLEELPESVRPIHLPKEFARVANNIASTWKRPLECDKVFADLLLDNRGTRQGFPLKVLAEIYALSEYHSTIVFLRTKKPDSWY